jgi:hypothetical protein
LRKRGDIGLLLELSMMRDAHEEMNDLIFHGRHLFSLYTTLRKETPGAEGYKTLETEFAAAIERIRDMMARVMVEADEEHVERFNTVYYAATHGSLRNVIDLAHDLGILKNVQNEKKYGGSGE